MTEQQRERWHVGLIPTLSFSIALVVQAVAIIWWASDINSRLRATEADVSSHEGRLEQVTRDQNSMSIAAGRLEERLLMQGQTLGEIKTILQQMQRQP